jgi:RecA/RadA recombinase
VRRVDERVAVGDVELLVVDVVQEHVDAREVVGRQVDLLAVEALPHVVLAEHLGELQQQRARAARRVVDLVDLGLADDRDAGEQLD